MKINYYKSAICPKCIPTSRFLKKLKEEYPELEINEIEVITHIKSSIQNKISSIPLIEIGDKRFYGVPDRDEVLKLTGLG